MLVYGLRLLVALITFSVGVAFSWLIGSEQSTKFEKHVVTSTSILVAAPSLDAPPPRSECSLNRRPRVVMGGVLNGKTVSKPEPVYPQAARAAGVGGTVVVQIEIEEDGSVVTAEAISGPLLLREAAEEAAREARFSPTRLSGEPVKVSGVVTYNFWLR